MIGWSWWSKTDPDWAAPFAALRARARDEAVEAGLYRLAAPDPLRYRAEIEGMLTQQQSRLYQRPTRVVHAQHEVDDIEAGLACQYPYRTARVSFVRALVVFRRQGADDSEVVNPKLALSALAAGAAVCLLRRADLREAALIMAGTGALVFAAPALVTAALAGGYALKGVLLASSVATGRTWGRVRAFWLRARITAWSARLAEHTATLDRLTAILTDDIARAYALARHASDLDQPPSGGPSPSDIHPPHFDQTGDSHDHAVN